MFQTTATIRNRDGIHCRPSALIIKSMSEYAGSIRIEGERGHTPLNSVIGLMSLALLPGDRVTITVEGPDEESTANKVAALFETHFDFPARPDGSRPFLQNHR